MLFMVIEYFKNNDFAATGERFRRQGRMMPDNLIYHASWIDGSGARCFQVMEGPSVEAFKEWTRRWDDLVDFEIIPVQTSSEFWKS